MWFVINSEGYEVENFETEDLATKWADNYMHDDVYTIEYR